MTRFNKDKAREELRTVMKIKENGRLDDLDPTRDYRWCNIELTGTGKTGMRWLDDALDRGWEIEFMNKEPVDEKTESKQTPKKESLKPSPETKQTQFQGKVCVLLSIEKSKNIENIKEDVKKRNRDFRAQQRLVTRRGQRVSIQGEEINFEE